MQVHLEVASAVPLQYNDPSALPSKDSDSVYAGWGACTVPLCGCSQYVSDSQNDGTCVCGHTAAKHG